MTAIRRYLRMMRAAGSPIRCGLRMRSGEWMAALGGWTEGSRATIIFQTNNDIDYSRMSLAIVLRGYAIESFIQKDASELFFWAGIGDTLDKVVEHIPTTLFYFDKPGLPWRVYRAVCRRVRPLLGQRMTALLDTVVPPAPGKINA